MADDHDTPLPSPWPTGASSPHVSWLLSELEASGQLLPSVACRDCPAALWYATPHGLRSYRGIFRMVVWGDDNFDPKAHSVISCDGREKAILEMLEAQAKAADPM